MRGALDRQERGRDGEMEAETTDKDGQQQWQMERDDRQRLIKTDGSNRDNQRQGKQQWAETNRKTQRWGKERGGEGTERHGAWGGRATEHEAELKRTLQSKRPTARPREWVRRELKTLGDGTGETETQREIQREKKTRTFKEKALLETSERRALWSWGREWQS